jgi:glycosyltransferase involved in cell wall biosynthesis
VTIHDLILLRYPTILNTTRSAFFYFIKFLSYRFVIACAVWRAKHIITVSHFTKKDILKHYPGARGKISVTYEAADAFCQMLTWQEEWKLFERLKLLDEKQRSEPKKVTRAILKPYILYVGNAYPHKNLEAFLPASVSFPDFTFVLVGKEDYFYARLKKTAREQGIKNILFTDFVDDRELNTLYRFSVCYIFPSFYEGFGLPPLEAMARGLPVISSDQGALPEILGDAAQYFNPHIAGSLEKELAKIINAKTERAEFIRRGYIQAARYNWEAMARETLAIYTASVDNKK